MELSSLVSYNIASIAARLLWYTTPILVSLVTFVSYTKIGGNELDAPTAFTGLALFNLLRVPLLLLPNIVVELIHTRVCLNRISKFLEEDELEKYKMDYNGSDRTPFRDFGRYRDDDDDDDDSGHDEKGKERERVNKSSQTELKIGFTNATFEWYKDDNISGSSTEGQQSLTALENIDIKFPIGKLTVICGPTGCGKSSLFSAFLGGEIFFFFHSFLSFEFLFFYYYRL